jgi:hypothetical protein
LYPSAKQDRWFTSFYLLIGIAIMTGMFAAQRELVASGRRHQLQARTKKLGKEMRDIRDTLRASSGDVNMLINEDMDVEDVTSSQLDGKEEDVESGGATSSISKMQRTSAKDLFIAMSMKDNVVRRVVNKLGRKHSDRVLLHEFESLNIEQYDEELMVRRSISDVTCYPPY